MNVLKKLLDKIIKKHCPMVSVENTLLLQILRTIETSDMYLISI